MSKQNHQSMRALYQNPAVFDAVISYVNNRGTQRAVRLALRNAGATDQQITSIYWSKSMFVQREFEGRMESC